MKTASIKITKDDDGEVWLYFGSAIINVESIIDGRGWIVRRNVRDHLKTLFGDPA